MSRTPIMAGNWKMNLDHVAATSLVQDLGEALKAAGYDSSKSEAVVIPPFTDIRPVAIIIDGDKLPIAYGAQDISAHDDGAYTGEVSGAMLSKLGCRYVVVGHSERREYHNESDELVNAKAKKVIENGMTPIICCGEALEVRKAGKHVEHTVGQIKADLDGIPAEQVAKLVIAYEPIWPSALARLPPLTMPRRSARPSARPSRSFTTPRPPRRCAFSTVVRLNRPTSLRSWPSRTSTALSLAEPRSKLAISPRS
ncbi:triosephosphate isomerase [Cutibacterium acnes JCM 18918]|nr:triosephosphate isomerase [Cutibacterium acnes JCM 18918]